MIAREEYLELVVDELFEELTVKEGESVLYTNNPTNENRDKIEYYSIVGQGVKVTDRHEGMINQYIYSHYDQFLKYLEKRLLIADKRYNIDMSTINRNDLKIYSELFFSKGVMPDLIFNIKEGKWSINRFCIRYLGYEEKEIDTIDLKDLIHPSDLKRYRQIMRSMYKKLTHKGNSIEEPIRLKNKSGDYVKLYVEIVPIYIERYPVILFTIKRMIQVNSLEEKAYLLTKNLELERHRNEFFSTISHEFKTPLNVILSSITLLNSILEEQTDNKSLVNKHLENIENNSNKVIKRVNSVMNLVKLGTDAYELKCDYYNFVEIVENTINYANKYLNQIGIPDAHIVFDTEVEEKVVWCDDRAIEQIVINSIETVIKYTGKKFYAWVTINDKGYEVEVLVRVKGSKIRPEVREFLENTGEFIVYPAKDIYDTALVVNVSTGLLRLHKGRFVVKQYEKYSEVRMILPACKDREEYVIRKESEKVYKEICKVSLADLIT